MRNFVPIAIVLNFLFAAAAKANDSTAELATGGLIFTQSDAIEMRAEDLFISATEVRVRYLFVNKTARDVTVSVAFPLPEIRISGPDQNLALPTEDPVNFVDFTTEVDGKPVATKVEQHVVAGSVDRTAYLRHLGVPLAPQLMATGQALDRLPPETWTEMQRMGLAEVEEYDAGQGMQKHLAPRWALHTTFYWEQTFPAGGETVIEHQYRPSVGLSVETSLGDPSAVREAWYADYLRKYCIDNDLLTTLARMGHRTANEFGAPYSEQRIDYVLKTGANWSGPIGDFRLVVDKGAPGNLVSFCGEGVRKISPTQFEMHKRNFIPTGDLSILILRRITNN